MNLIQRCRGTKSAQEIVNLENTASILANCYFPELYNYGYACDVEGQVFLFSESKREFLFYKSFEDARHEFVLLNELNAELSNLSKVENNTQSIDAKGLGDVKQELSNVKQRELGEVV